MFGNFNNENQEQWEMEREIRRGEIPSEAQLSQEKKIPEQEMSSEAQLGETDNGLNNSE